MLMSKHTDEVLEELQDIINGYNEGVYGDAVDGEIRPDVDKQVYEDARERVIDYDSFMKGDLSELKKIYKHVVRIIEKGRQ